MSKERIFSVETADESSGFLLWQVTSLWQRDIRKALQMYDVTHSQFVLLASTLWLTMNNSIVTQVMLSEHSKIDPMTTSQVLRTLQAKGLLKREAHKTDTRAKCIVLTENGKKLTKQAVKTIEAVDKVFFESIGTKHQVFNKQLKLLLAQNNA